MMRLTMERESTATVFILEDKKALLIFHRKFQKWLPPGGHIAPNETPAEAARREAKEETGLEISLIAQENIWITKWNAKSFERPYLCLLEEVPAYHNVPAHQHIDFIYVGRPAGGRLRQNREETAGIRWFTLEEIKNLVPGQDIFAETVEIIEQLLVRQEAAIGV
ncbi:MAG: NUDIX domain-containing protein [Waddliaceae bacterium]